MWRGTAEREARRTMTIGNALRQEAPAQFLIYGTGIRNDLNSRVCTTNSVLIYGNHPSEDYVAPPVPPPEIPSSLPRRSRIRRAIALYSSPGEDFEHGPFETGVY